MNIKQKLQLARAVKNILRILHGDGKCSYLTTEQDGTFNLLVIKKPRKGRR